MKTSLENLPERKRNELKLMVGMIREACDVEMIILFGSYARGNWVEEKADDGVHFKYQSDFDIFIVTETEHQAIKLEENHHLEQGLRQVLRTPITLIAHDIQFFNRRLRKGQYFFSDIKKEGIQLFDAEKFELAEAKELSFSERKKLAEEDYKYWFDNANEFFIDYKSAYERGSYCKAAFELHQVVERFYSAILLVYTRYKQNTHDLEKLRNIATSQEPRLIKIFPQGTEEEKKRFKLLRKAYVDAR